VDSEADGGATVLRRRHSGGDVVHRMTANRWSTRGGRRATPCTLPATLTPDHWTHFNHAGPSARRLKH